MGKNKKHIPIRTCISCGVKRNKDGLIRLAVDQDRLVVRDPLYRLPGRGAYVCSNESCLKKVLKNKRLKKIFRIEENVGVSIEV